jgi:hypothetical protein
MIDSIKSIATRVMTIKKLQCMSIVKANLGVLGQIKVRTFFKSVDGKQTDTILLT